jgi:recombination protein RecA
MYGHGISKEGSLIDTALDRGIVSRSGAWYLYEGDQLGQGRENAKAFLAEHPDVYGEIEGKIKLALGLVPAEDGPPGEKDKQEDESNLPA